MGIIERKHRLDFYDPPRDGINVRIGERALC